MAGNQDGVYLSRVQSHTVMLLKEVGFKMFVWTKQCENCCMYFMFWHECAPTHIQSELSSRQNKECCVWKHELDTQHRDHPPNPKTPTNSSHRKTKITHTYYTTCHGIMLKEQLVCFIPSTINKCICVSTSAWANPG